MTHERTIKILVEKLADESRRNRNSAIAFCFIGAAVQIDIILAPGLPTAETVPAFAFLSLIFAWIPLAAGVYYFRQSSRKAARPENLLWRALTSEPQLIREIIVEIPQAETPAQRNAEIVDNQRQNVVGNILDGVFGGDSTPDYTINSTSGVELKPSVFVKLPNGENYLIPSPLEAAETVAALKGYAPHAAIVEKDQINARL